VNSFTGWIGGKKLLRTEIVKRFPEKIGRYIEVCGGAGWVLFYKDRHADMEVYNDVNSNLVNLFRCIKYHCPELQRELSLC
jgi:DNA adenine methylase